MSETQLCTFTVGKLLCGVSVLDVQEVVRERELTTVPLADPSLKGLLNLRGDVIAAIDLRRRLQLPDREDDAATTHVIVRCGDEAVSLVVDAVEDVLTLSSSTFEEPPQTVTGIAREYISGVHKLESRLLLVLDAKRIALPSGER
jgi:purine-binding chemotaxis protein CheW